VNDYIKALLAKVGDRPLKIILEPGRSIAANAGVLLTKVEFLKHNEDKHFAVIDAAMNDLLRPSLYSAWQNIVRVEEAEGPNCERHEYDLVGPICETGDFLGKDRDLSLQAGDLLAVMSSGAYGFAMSSNYNTRNRVAELVVDGDQVVLARKRETIEDQLALESLMP
jgi:diaminopimelate decarboxylase